MIFSANLLKAREAVGLTQRELSDLSGISQKHISQIELTGSNVTLDTLAELARHLNTTAADFLLRRAPTAANNSCVRISLDVLSDYM